MKILIIQTAFIGDVVLATSLIEKLTSHHPDAAIHFLLRKGNEGLLSGHPHLKKIWVWDKKESKYRNLFRLIFAIRAEEFDVVINCQRFTASGLLTVFSKAKSKIGYSKNPFSLFFSERYAHVIGKKNDASYLHEIERNQQLIARLTDSIAVNPKLYPSIVDYESVKKFKANKYITICPASVWYTKQFPAARWMELSSMIPESYNVYLLGGLGDSMLCEEMKNLFPGKNMINLAGELSFLQTAALMNDAAMNYTNDSAPLHFASAMNAKVTAVFCSTIPQFGFGPLSSESHVLEEKQHLYCRPCGLHGYKSCPEKHFKCAWDLPIVTFLGE
ncbi:MAG: glycosyltransferase family 9 protein [Chitinophagales bacterium]